MRLISMAGTVMAVALLTFVQVATSTAQYGPFILPQTLQHEIASRYPEAKLVTLSELDNDDRALFQKDHGNACPGLVKVDFYGDGEPTLAMVLITKGGACSGSQS